MRPSLTLLARAVKPDKGTPAEGRFSEEQSPVREAVVHCGTRKSTAANAFPGGGHFAWLPGAATVGRGAGPFCLPAGRQIRPQPSGPAGRLNPVSVTLDSRRGGKPRSQGGSRVRLDCPKRPRLWNRVPQHIRQQPALTQKALNPSWLPKAVSMPSSSYPPSQRPRVYRMRLLWIRTWLFVIGYWRSSLWFCRPEFLASLRFLQIIPFGACQPSRGRGSLPAASHSVHFS